MSCRSSDRILLVDSREKWTQTDKPVAGRNVKAWFKQHNIPYTVCKLDVGDYLYPDGSVSVDRKGSLNELSTNLMNRTDSARFWREVRRAKETGLQLIVLVECSAAIRSVRDVVKWRSEYTHVTGSRLANEMTRLELSYGVQFRFCDKRNTGRMILALLNETDKHRGENIAK